MDVFVELKALIGDFQSKMAAARGEMEATSKAGGNHFSQLSAVGKGALLGIAGAAVGVGVVSLKMGADFQQSMSKLVTSGGEAATNLKTDMGGVEKLMGQTGTSADQLSAGLYMINSAGFHAKDGLTVLKAAAEGAKTENADLATVTDGLTTLLNDYHLKASDAALVTSKMVTATSLGKTTFQDLAGSLHTVAPAAEAVGLSLNEVLGAMATMTAKGTPAADAATYLRQTILQLSNPSHKASLEMDALGLSSIDVSKNLGERGLTGTLDLLTGAIEKKMGPAGTVLLNNLKQAAAAGSKWAQSLQEMTPAQQDQIKSLADMGVQVDKVKEQVAGGTKETAAQKEMIAEYQAKLNGMPATFRSVLEGLIANKLGYKDLNSTVAELPPVQQTAVAALADMVGGTKSMQAALELTGGSASTFSANVQKVSKTTTEAGGHVAGWATVQQNFNQKLAEAKGQAEALGIKIGLALIPKVEQAIAAVQKIVDWFGRHKAAAEALAAVITGVLGVAIAAFTVNKIAGLVKGVQNAIGVLTSLGSKSTAVAGDIEGMGSSATGFQGKLSGALGVAGAGMAAFGLTTLALKSNFLGLGDAINSAASAVANFLGVGPQQAYNNNLGRALNPGDSAEVSLLQQRAAGLPSTLPADISSSDAMRMLHNMGIPGYATGGWVKRTGLIFAHAGEYVVPPSQAAAPMVSRGGAGPGGDLVIQMDGQEFVRVAGPKLRTWLEEKKRQVATLGFT